MASLEDKGVGPDGIHRWELNLQMNMDVLSVARMNLITGGPVTFSSPGRASYMQTPWQYYSKVFKKQYGYYPEMWGYTTLKDESEETFPI